MEKRGLEGSGTHASNQSLRTVLKLASVPLLLLLNGFLSLQSWPSLKSATLETGASQGHRLANIARRSVRNFDASLSETQLASHPPTWAWVGDGG
jgi:hypothetical protein